MKYVIVILAMLSFIFIGANSGKTDVNSSATNTDNSEMEYPIAAGVWYPQNGPIPDKPMRYYRVRCWPGCHTGSALGKYPAKTLMDKPIYPTSTVKAHAAGKSKNYK